MNLKTINKFLIIFCLLVSGCSSTNEIVQSGFKHAELSIVNIEKIMIGSNPALNLRVKNTGETDVYNVSLHVVALKDAYPNPWSLVDFQQAVVAEGDLIRPAEENIVQIIFLLLASHFDYDYLRFEIDFLKR